MAKSKATNKQKACGGVYPPTEEEYTHTIPAGNAHQWKFIWQDSINNEPQARRCSKCGYTLFFYQCTQKWGEVAPFIVEHLKDKHYGRLDK